MKRQGGAPEENVVKKTLFCLALGALTVMTGCASSMLAPASPGYDTQGCVEDALRRSSDQELALEASSQFRQACDESDWAACSALGVISESGAAGAHDDREASRLYARGCDGGNARSCVNLGKLLERVSLGESNATRINALFADACDRGEAFGCAALGHALAHGDARSRDRAIELLGNACRDGRSEACFDLAELERRGSMPTAVALEHYTKACVAGNALACQRLDPDPIVASR